MNKRKKEQKTFPTTWEGYLSAFQKGLEKVSKSYSIKQVFVDVCRVMSLSLRGQLVFEKEKEEVESAYMKYVDKYGREGMREIANLFAIVVEALEIRHTDFLGQVYEHLNATVKDFGQFLTPICVSEFLAKCTLGEKIVSNEIVKIYDPTCGAGVLLLEGARQYIEQGGKQRNLLIYADDLDETACCIAYVQFSLLGYAAVIRRVDTLLNKVYEGPWYTAGYFLHSFPMRLIGGELDKQRDVYKGEVTKDCECKPSKSNAPINVRDYIQGELF